MISRDWQSWSREVIKVADGVYKVFVIDVFVHELLMKSRESICERKEVRILLLNKFKLLETIRFKILYNHLRKY